MSQDGSPESDILATQSKLLDVLRLQSLILSRRRLRDSFGRWNGRPTANTFCVVGWRRLSTLASDCASASTWLLVEMHEQCGNHKTFPSSSVDSVAQRSNLSL